MTAETCCLSHMYSVFRLQVHVAHVCPPLVHQVTAAASLALLEATNRTRAQRNAFRAPQGAGAAPLAAQGASRATRAATVRLWAPRPAWFGQRALWALTQMRGVHPALRRAPRAMWASMAHFLEPPRRTCAPAVGKVALAPSAVSRPAKTARQARFRRRRVPRAAMSVRRALTAAPLVLQRPYFAHQACLDSLRSSEQPTSHAVVVDPA